jgi:hypothetical protein
MGSFSVAFYVEERSRVTIAVEDGRGMLTRLTRNGNALEIEKLGEPTMDRVDVELDPGVYGFVTQTTATRLKYAYDTAIVRAYTKGGKDPWPLPPPPPPTKTKATFTDDVWKAYWDANSGTFASVAGGDNQRLTVEISAAGNRSDS